MDVLSKLASADKRNDEELNIELAKEIVDTKNKEAVQSLINSINSKGITVQNDCIKVLYEIGERNPALISDYLDDFVALLSHKNNRLQWGAMTALYCIAKIQPEKIFSFLPKILDAASAGSVITLDNAVNILVELCKAGDKKIYQKSFTELIKIIATAPENQVAMYGERGIEIVNVKTKTEFSETINNRLLQIEKESKRKRLEKLLTKANKIE